MITIVAYEIARLHLAYGACVVYVYVMAEFLIVGLVLWILLRGLR